MTEADRIIAARHLREARRSTGHEALEAVAWARCAVPRSVRAIVFEARLTIEQGDAAEADALIAQGLLLAPADASLLTLHARRLLDRGLVERAGRVADLALSKRPYHVGLRRLAARIARARGDAAQAADHLRAALRIGPAGRRGVLSDLIVVLLELDRTEEARTLVNTLDPPSLYLESLIVERLEGPLAALDRLTDASPPAEHASGAVAPADESDSDSSDHRLERRIDLADRVGDGGRLDDALQAVSRTTPRALRRAVRVWLRRGEFETVLERLEITTDRPDASRERPSDPTADQSILAAVAHVALGRSDEAELLLSRHPRRESVCCRHHVADAWRDALIGMLTRGVTRPDGRLPFDGAPLLGAFLSDDEVPV